MDCADKIKEIRKMSGMNRRDFCDTYQIPYQTVTDWELGHRNAPEYVVRMLEYYVRMHEIEDIGVIRDVIQRAELTEQ